MAGGLSGAEPQTKSSPPAKAKSEASKKEVKPVEGFAVAPVVLADEGCTRDYVRALQSEGVELRKKLTDLQAYACVDTSAQAIFSAVAIERKDFAVSKDEVVYFRLVMIKFDPDRTKAAIGGEGHVVTPPAKTVYVGWIPEERFYAVSPEAFDRLLAEKKIPMTIK